jgi:hypothetical protein
VLLRVAALRNANIPTRQHIIDVWGTTMLFLVFPFEFIHTDSGSVLKELSS